MTYENSRDLLLREKNGFTIYVVHDSNFFKMWVYIYLYTNTQKKDWNYRCQAVNCDSQVRGFFL